MKDFRYQSLQRRRKTALCFVSLKFKGRTLWEPALTCGTELRGDIGQRKNAGLQNMPLVDPDTYGQALMQRANEVAVVPRISVHVDDWMPQPNMCHYNVSYFCEHNAGHTPVRGWLYFELPGLTVAKFLSHSVVRAPDGVLYDITPWEATQHYPFLASNLTEDEYADLVEEQGVGALHPAKI